MGNPRHFRSESFHMVLLLLKQALRDQQRKIDILHTSFLEPAVQFCLDILPDRVTRRFDDHAALNLCVTGQFRLFDNICIPLGKINFHRSDLFHKLFILSHDAFSLL